MRTNTLVSCVIPVFNGERFLGEAIDSVLRQSHRELEIIVVDDGSTDGSRTVVHNYREQVVYIHQQNAGPSVARNTGIRSSSGAYVAFLDADDIWHPEKIAVQTRRFDERPDLAICTTHMRNFRTEGPGSQVWDEQFDAAPQPNLASSFVARKTLFDEIGFLDGALRHRDLHEFVLRATDQGRVVEALHDVLVDRRIHDANMSRVRNNEGEMELLTIARARLARRGQRNA